MSKYVADNTTGYEADMDNFVQAAVNGNGIVSGCGVTALGTPAMGVQIASGVIGYGAVPVTVNAVANLTIANSDPSNARYDVIHVNSVGTVAAITGTPSATPKPPALPATSLLLAYVSVSAGATNIQNSNITNRILGVQAMCLAGTAASRPAAGNAGLLYFATDTSVFSRDNGASWATINNNGALFLAQDGTVAAPGFAFNSETGSGLYRIGAGDVGLSILGVKVAEFTATTASIVQNLTLGQSASRIVPGATSLSLRNNANNADNLIITDAGNATVRGTLTVPTAQFISFGGTGVIYNDGTVSVVRSTGVANDLIVGSGYLSVGATPSTAGTVRIPAGALLAWRNNANNNNSTLGYNSSTTDAFTFLVSGSPAMQVGAGFIDLGSTPATAGIIRIPNANDIYGRNAANSANQRLIGIDASNNILVGDATVGAVTVVGTSALSVGTTPATTGAIRYPNGQFEKSRNAANSGDLSVIGYNASNQLILADSAAGDTTLRGGTVNFQDMTPNTVTGTVPTLAGIGNGPVGAAQSGWLRIQVGGVNRWVPLWT